MRRLSTGIENLLDRVRQKMMAGSLSAILAALLGAFGLFWFGLALHWALAPAVGIAWAWLIPSLLYLLAAGGIAVAVFGRTPESDRPGDMQTRAAPSLPLLAEQLGMELGKGVERELHRRPLRTVSIAALGGVVLGASPELRRGLQGLFSDPREDPREQQFRPYDRQKPENNGGRS